MLRIEGAIPPLVELLEYADPKVQKSAAGALRTLAFKNDENKNQVFLTSVTYEVSDYFFFSFFTFNDVS